MSSLVDSARRQRDQAAAAVARLEASLQGAAEKLHALSRYQTEQRQRSIRAGGAGTVIGQVGLHHRFDQSLQRAIDEQRQRVSRATEERDAGNERLRGAQQRLAALEALADRRQARTNLAERRREQRGTDEAAARQHAQRKRGNTHE